MTSEPVPHRAIITVCAMIATLMQALDGTIANVALPYMQGGLAATGDQITWVLTSYIVASAIAIPIAGWLADRIGRKRLLVLAVIGFTIASFLCAIAQSLPEMVAFRIIQGITGAFLVPLSQATLFDINPPHKHAQAMAMFGGAMVPLFFMPPWMLAASAWSPVRWTIFALEAGMSCARNGASGP